MALAIHMLPDPAKLTRLANCLMIAVAASLPWSTSATAILVVLWLLVLFGVAGMLWADVTLAERWKGLDSFLKLLIIPLLFIHYRRSDRGVQVFAAYAISCVALLVVSLILAAWPRPVFLFSNDFGVPAKNAATQSGEFVTCIFGLLFVAHDLVKRQRWLWLGGLAVVILAMLADIFFVATGRTALIVLIVLLVLYALRMLSVRGIALLTVAAVVLGAIGWFSSPYLRTRTETIWTDFQKYEASDERNSSGERVEFARKSIAFIRAAPVIGHGTGSIRALFDTAATGQGAEASRTANPHNQTFAVAIQLGLLGAAVLWAMWIAHLRLFRGAGLASWIGLVVVTQNVVGSLFNSHLFDFTQGWTYVIGVGVAGGMVLKSRGSS